MSDDMIKPFTADTAREMTTNPSDKNDIVFWTGSILTLIKGESPTGKLSINLSASHLEKYISQDKVLMVCEALRERGFVVETDAQSKLKTVSWK